MDLDPSKPSAQRVLERLLARSQRMLAEPLPVGHENQRRQSFRIESGGLVPQASGGRFMTQVSGNRDAQAQPSPIRFETSAAHAAAFRV